MKHESPTPLFNGIPDKSVLKNKKKMSNKIAGIVFDASVLLNEDEDDDNNIASLRPGLDSLLPFGVSCGQGLSPSKVLCIQQIANLYSCNCFMWKSSSKSKEDFISEVSQAFSEVRGYIVHVISSQIEDDLVLKLKDSLCVIVLLSEFCHLLIFLGDIIYSLMIIVTELFYLDRKHSGLLIIFLQNDTHLFHAFNTYSK